MAIPNKLTTGGSGMNRTAASMTNPEISGTPKNTDEEICRHGGVARNRRRHSFVAVLDLPCRLLFAATPEGVAIPLARFVGVALLGLGIACLRNSRDQTAVPG